MKNEPGEHRCPRLDAGLGPECIGHACPGYCSLVDDGIQRYIDIVLAWTAPAPEVSYSDGPRVPAPATIAIPAAPVSVRPEVAESLALVARMKACPSWVASSSCGCGANKCLAGRGRQGIVNHVDCFACLREADSLTEDSHPSPEDCGS